MEALLLYTTWPSDESAKAAARVLVEEHLVACANYWPMSSVYRWEGRIAEENEVVMILKTTRNVLPQTMERIGLLHSYHNPCILVLPVDGGANPFLQWVAQEVC